MDDYVHEPEVARCLEKLHKLILREQGQEQNAMDGTSDQASFHEALYRAVKARSLDTEATGDIFDDSKENLNPELAVTLDLHAATEEYNIAVTRQISRHVLSKLPRELRDMIYNSLVPDRIKVCNSPLGACPRTLLHVHDYAINNGDGRYRNQSIPAATNRRTDWHGMLSRTKRDLICPQHFWRDEVIGAARARELIEAFYRRTVFVVGVTCLHGHTPLQALPLLLKDRFQLDLPASSWISNLEIGMNIYVGRNTTTQARRSQTKTVSDGMSALHSLKKISRIDIKLGIMKQLGGVADRDHMDNLMVVFLEGLEELRQSGYRLSFQCSVCVSDPEIERTLEHWLCRLDQEASRVGMQKVS